MTTNDQLTWVGATFAITCAIGLYMIDQPHAGACFLLAAIGVWVFNRSV